MASRKGVVVLGGARTPMGQFNGRLAGMSETDLGAHAARAALERTGTEARNVDHVVFGNALQAGQNAIYGARHAALKAGLPQEVPALTVNRLCGSGIQSVINAAQLIQLDEADTVLAGGMETMSQAPHVIRNARRGVRLGHTEMEDLLFSSLLDMQCGFTMAETAENLAADLDIPRAAQDEYALRSQQAAAAAYEAGRIQEEIAPIEIKGRKGTTVVDGDDHRKPDTTLAGLAKLPPAFRKDGCVTAGNASGIVDGGAAVVLCSEEAASKHGGRPIGRIVDWAYAGVEPRIMGIGPVPATRRVLERAGVALADVDLVEVNEAFAAQYLAVEKELGLDRDRTNVNGGAIALGHPLGATGTRIILSSLMELQRRGGRYALCTACIGGGQGIAILLERA